MFGLGFTEMVVIAIVLLLVVGPKELPKMLRSLGQGIHKLRRMSTDLRAQSGIDEIIHDEGLREDLEALRSLSRGRVVDALVEQTQKPSTRKAAGPSSEDVPALELSGEPPERSREYPVIGCDAYDALPEDAADYLPSDGDAAEAPGDDAPPADDQPGSVAELGAAREAP